MRFCKLPLWHIAAISIAFALFLGAAIWRVRTGPFDGMASWGITMVELAGSACLTAGGRLAATVVFERIPAAKIHDTH